MPDKPLPSLLERHWAESALAIGAIVIAAASLWVAYDANVTNQELVAAASWPFMRTDYSNGFTTASGRPLLTVSALNSGIGPAKVESVEVFWHGKAYHDAAGLLRGCCGLTRRAAQQSQSRVLTASLQGTVVRPGQTVNLIWYPKPAQDEGPWERLNAIMTAGRVFPEVRICYCSAFNQCWISNGHTLDPPRVSACPVPKISYDN